MSRKGNPWDNAACESFMKTLKYVEVPRNDYRDLAEARFDPPLRGKNLNQKRLHLALGLGFVDTPVLESVLAHNSDALAKAVAQRGLGLSRRQRRSGLPVTAVQDLRSAQCCPKMVTKSSSQKATGFLDATFLEH